MSKPNIAILCGQDQPEKGDEPKTNEVNSYYTRAILMAGGLPFLIPVEFPIDTLMLIFERFEGLLLIGGEDVALDRYGGISHESVSIPNLERDEIEIQLVREAMRRNFPLLGICRGQQVMNVAMGGTLISDIPSQTIAPLVHYAPKGEPPAHHLVTLEPDSKLKNIYQEDSIETNSYHHQAVDKLAACFTRSAFSFDDLLEAFEAPEQPFAFGLQWHPERMQSIPLQRKIFNAFISAANVRR